MYIVREPKVAMGAPLTVTRALLACRFRRACGKGFTKLISAPLSTRNNKPDSLSLIRRLRVHITSGSPMWSFGLNYCRLNTKF